MSEPQITVGMPVYNEAKYISETLDSVLSQTYRNFEVIISDNNSKDGTYEILQEYTKKRQKIKSFQTTEKYRESEKFQVCFRQSSKPIFHMAFRA